MPVTNRTRFRFIAVLVAGAAFGLVARSQQTHYPKQTQLPDAYRLVAGWPTLPKSMNGGYWGEVIRVSVDSRGTFGFFIDASMWCRRGAPRASIAEMRIRRSWSSILRANC